MEVIEDKVLSLQSEKTREGKIFFYKEKSYQTSSTTTRFRTIMLKDRYYNKVVNNRGWLALMNKIPSDMFNYYDYDER